MIRKIAAAAAAWLLSSAGYCIDSVSLEAGRGDDRTSLIRFAIQDLWRKREAPVPEWRLAGYWDFSAALWDNRDESTADIGVTPVFRIEHRAIYLEAAVGFHLVSTRISAARVFSTAFQFGDHLAAGLRFGEGDRYDIGMVLQHLSNGHLRTPNPGINFVLVRLQYCLE
ncbi:MAG: acyloxyacyl hydrolase [Burkholderiales bacterium]